MRQLTLCPRRLRALCGSTAGRPNVPGANSARTIKLALVAIVDGSTVGIPRRAVIEPDSRTHPTGRDREAS